MRRLKREYGEYNTKGQLKGDNNTMNWYLLLDSAYEKGYLQVHNDSLYKSFQATVTYSQLIKKKMAACKKCYHKPYYGLSFELPQPKSVCDSIHNGEYKEGYSSYLSSEYLISKRKKIEYSNDYYEYKVV